MSWRPPYSGLAAIAPGLSLMGTPLMGDPEAWKIVDGKLYVNCSKGVQRRWEENIPEYTEQGQANWPAVPNK